MKYYEAIKNIFVTFKNIYVDIYWCSNKKENNTKVASAVLMR